MKAISKSNDVDTVYHCKACGKGYTDRGSLSVHKKSLCGEVTMTTTTIGIAKGTIVGRLTGDRKLVPVTLVGDASVEATRESDGSWKYQVAGSTYFYYPSEDDAT